MSKGKPLGTLKMPGKNGGTLYACRKGETANPRGRPKKLATILKVDGYTGHQINETFARLGALTVDQIKAFSQNPKATVVERGVCKLYKDLVEKGRLDAMDYIVAKKQPKLVVESKVTSYEIPSDDAEASRIYQELMKSE